MKIEILNSYFKFRPKTISYILQVDDISPQTASKLGGNEITITGSGFADGSTVVRKYL